MKAKLNKEALSALNQSPQKKASLQKQKLIKLAAKQKKRDNTTKSHLKAQGSI